MIDRALVLPRLLEHRARETPDRPYLDHVAGGSLTYADTHEANLAWAAAYHAISIGVGDTVAVMLPTSFAAVHSWLGLSWLGAIEVPVHTAYRGQLLSQVLNDSQAAVLLIDTDLLGRVAEVARDLKSLRTLIVTGDLDSAALDLPFIVIPLDEFLDGRSRHAEFAGPRYTDVARILYTSGTTGNAKGVMVTWTQLYKTAIGMVDLLGFGPSDAYYSPFPMAHLTGQHSLYVMGIAGGRAVLRESFRTSDYWSDVRRLGCTVTTLLGAMANFLYRAPPLPEDAETPLSRVVMVPVLPEVKEFEERFGLTVHTLYNMTEISTCIINEGPVVANPKSCGRVRPGYDCRLVDEDDQTVVPGEVGELVVRADDPWALMAGYWRQPEQTLETLRNLWLHTGDLFRNDEDGNFYFLDRKGDSIRRRAENISSADVEAEVLRHPAIEACAVVGVPSEWGEEEVLLVATVKHDHELHPEQLIEFLRERMTRFMVPRFVRFEAALPITATGKIRKAELKALGVTPDTWDGDARRASSDGSRQ